MLDEGVNWAGLMVQERGRPRSSAQRARGAKEQRALNWWFRRDRDQILLPLDNHGFPPAEFFVAVAVPRDWDQEQTTFLQWSLNGFHELIWDRLHRRQLGPSWTHPCRIATPISHLRLRCSLPKG